MNKFKKVIEDIGLPRLIIGAFFLVLVVSSVFLGLKPASIFSDILRRVVMYSILVLAMVPGVQAGIGLNFGISLGIAAGLFGSVVAMEIAFRVGWTENMNAGGLWLTLGTALLLSIVLATLFGSLYGMLLNRVKGSEMTVATYVGFSIIAFMNIVWLMLYFSNGDLIWPLQGRGMRSTVSLAGSFGGILSDPVKVQATQPAWLQWLAIKAGDITLPIGAIILLTVLCILVWFFFRSKAGIAMSAAGENQLFTRSSGINVDRMRIMGTALSTVLGAIGIIVYASIYGFLQLYNAPLMMGFASVAAVLIGGATVTRANIANVLIGTLLFQGILSMALPVINEVVNIGTLPEIMRIIISNGIILYALSKTKGGRAA